MASDNLSAVGIALPFWFVLWAMNGAGNRDDGAIPEHDSGIGEL